MPTAKSIVADLKSKGNEKTRALYGRHGMVAERCLGVNVADLKIVLKTIKGQQALAMELYETGVMEAMYLAGMVADGAKMSEKQLMAWAEGAAGMQMIGEYTVPWVTVDHPKGRELALQWIGSKKEHMAASGWSTYAGLVALTPDEKLDLAEIEGLLDDIVKRIHTAQNRVRQTMNQFVIAVGSYVMPLSSKAKAAALKMGTVIVDMGETECKVPSAMAYIEKVETMGKAGKKRKTIRC